MNPITIITIVVVALLTIVIFALIWAAYTSCLKTYDMEIGQGRYDDELLDNHRKGKKKGKGGLVAGIASYTLLLALVGLFITGIVYKAGGENFHLNDQTVLVIKSGSMSGFYDESIAEEYRQLGYDTNLQFGIGDLCMFERVGIDVALKKGDVYGYKYRDMVITHRLIDIDGTNCKFQGDNNPGPDYIISRDKVVYHYMNKRIPVLGVFILYSQSYLGMWSIAGITGIVISSEITYGRVGKINDARLRHLGVGKDEE